MKKLSILSILLLLVLVTMACNLSQYMSDTPPAVWNTPTAVINEESVFAEDIDSCIPQSAIQSNYNLVDVNIIKESEQLNQLTTLLKNIFQDAKITRYDTFINNDRTKVLSCVYLSPINTLEKSSFDFILKNPDTFIQLVDVPELTIEMSSLTGDYDQVGENRILLHISFGNENSKSAELMAIRFEDSVAIYSFIYPTLDQNLDDFKNVLSAIQ